MPANGSTHSPERSAYVCDPAALTHLYEMHRPALLARLTHLTKGDSHWAEDILQETLLRAWRNPQARNAEGRWSQGWLYTVARRILIDNVRSAQVRPREFPDERIDARPGANQDEFGRMLDRREVRAAVQALPDFQREVLIEIYFHDRSIEEVSRRLAIPPGTVKSRTFYALRALRDELATRGLNPDAIAA